MKHLKSALKIFSILFYSFGLTLVALALGIDANKYQAIGGAGNDCDGVASILVVFIPGVIVLVSGSILVLTTFAMCPVPGD